MSDECLTDGVFRLVRFAQQLCCSILQEVIQELSVTLRVLLHLDTHTRPPTTQQCVLFHSNDTARVKHRETLLNTLSLRTLQGLPSFLEEQKTFLSMVKPRSFSHFTVLFSTCFILLSCLVVRHLNHLFILWKRYLSLLLLSYIIPLEMSI